MTIHGKVADVIPPYDIAINVGAGSGVSEGDEVTLYERVVVRDPDTQAELGRVEYVRGSFKIVVVAETFSIATTDDYLPISGPVTTFAMPNALSYNPPPRKQVVRTGASPLERPVTAIATAIGDAVRIEKPQATDIAAPDAPQGSKTSRPSRASKSTGRRRTRP